MIVLKILLGILFFVLILLLLLIFGKIKIEVELKNLIYYVKIKFYGITVFRVYTDKEIEMLVKKGLKKAKKVAAEVVQEEAEKSTADTPVQQVETAIAEKTEPQEQKPKEPEPKEKKVKEKATEEEASIISKMGGLGKILEFAKKALSKLSGYFLKKSKVERMILDLSVATQDMVLTAQLFGYLNAVVFRALENLGSYLTIKKQQINIYPNFHETEPKLYLDAAISMRVVNGLMAALWIYLDYRKIIKNQTKKDHNGGKENG